MKRCEAVDFAEATLCRAGYRVSNKCRSRSSCFDFVARKEENTIFSKFFSDIHDISLEDASEIKKISRCFSSVSIFISELYDQEKLKDDTVYSRYGIYVITSKTLENIINGAYPLVEAKPGGYYVRMNGSRIRDRRNELGLSIGKLAGMVGVSRNALYGYEKEMTKAAVSTAYKLEEILGVTLVQTIDIFSEKLTKDLWENDDYKNQKFSSILEKLNQFNFVVSHIVRAPFDFVAYHPKTKFRIIGVFAENKDENYEKRLEEVASICRIIEAKPLIIGKEKHHQTRDFLFLEYNAIS